MPRTYLLLRFADDGDGTGKLFARAEANGFAGEGEAYFGTEELEKFSIAIGRFPLPNHEDCSISGGFGKLGTSEVQEHLGIRVYAIDARGHIGLQIRMATEVWPQTRPESQKMAKIEILTSYEPLRRFSEDLAALVHEKTKEALIEGDPDIRS